MNRKTLTIAGAAFAMALGLSACGGEEEVEDPVQPSEEASQDMGADAGGSMDNPPESEEDPLPSAEATMSDDTSSMNGMDEEDGMGVNEEDDIGINEEDGMEDDMDHDPAAATREGETGGNVNSSGAMSQAEEAAQLNNSSSNTQ